MGAGRRRPLSCGRVDAVVAKRMGEKRFVRCEVEGEGEVELFADLQEDHRGHN